MTTIFLADLLGQYLQRAHTSVNRLAKLSGVPQRTIANWLNGFIQKPHQWQSLVRVALALHLNTAETNELLQAAGHLSIPRLRDKAHSKSDTDLLSNFHISPSPFPPFQAIADLSTFVGRISELENLKHILLGGGRAAICGLRGMGGVGKTSLAAHLAYQLRDEFPDGVLWGRLDTTDQLSILGAFADAYEKDVSQYRDVEGRASVVRGLLAQKRVLIILDNAETSAQVRPLLPPSTGNCAVLITTRHDLSALDGWAQMTLEPFGTESEESLQLFEKYLGLDFVHRHHIALMEIAGLVGHLPLALSIIAGHLVSDLSHTFGKLDQEDSVVVNLLDSLRSSQTRLSMLTRDDLGVRASFDVSYTTLPTRQRKLFATLGIFSGEDFGSDAVAYLTDSPFEAAETELKQLQALSLVQKSRYGRWHLHPLLKEYVREQLEINGWLNRVVEKTLLMYQQSARGERVFINPLDTEIPNIRFALDQASRLRLYRPLLETVQAIYPTLSIGAWFSLAHTALEQAREAAQAVGDLKADLFLLKGLSFVQSGLGDNKNARENLHLALQIAKSTEQEEEAADVLTMLGRLEHDMGYRRQASVYFEESLDLARKINSQHMIGRNLHNLAVNLVARARYAEAEKMLLEALKISRAKGGGISEHKVLMNLGEVYWHLRDWDRADTYWREALSLARANKYRAATVGLLAGIAQIHAIHGELAEAEQLSEEAIHLALEINSPRLESIARCELGHIFLKQKKFDMALEQLNQGRELASKAGDMEKTGTILRYLGLLYLNRMQLDKAYLALDEALNTAREIKHEIMIADTSFVLAKVAFANGERAKAKKWAGESLAIYERLDLVWQAEEIQRWMEDTNK